MKDTFAWWISKKNLVDKDKFDSRLCKILRSLAIEMYEVLNEMYET